MSARWPVRVAVAACCLGGLASGAVSAHEARDRVAIDWKRDAKAAGRRVEAPVPAAPELPQELAIATAPAAHVAASRVPGPPGGRPDLDPQASRAGEEAAREASRVYGFREYWRAGFARGLDAALDDPRLGGWDREEGRRFGRSDPRARELGDHIAREVAQGTADGQAEARVRERFMDLSREPRRDRADARGKPPEGLSPRFEGPFAREPVLDDVFTDTPCERTPGLSRDGARALGEWRVQPSFFAHGDRFARSYDAGWKDPAAAFERWRRVQSRGSTWSRLSPGDRDRFRATFCDRFEATLRSIDPRGARNAWRIGYEDGWRYGAAIQAEWAYRRGYAEGFDQSVRETAAIAFPYAYDQAYGDAYEHWFDEWSRNPHPGIAAVRLADENDDGVFEPGERLTAEVELVNYGGGPGTFDVIASGAALGPPAKVSVPLGGRGRLPGAERFPLRVADRVPPRTRGSVIVTVADARLDTPLYVSRPLEMDGAPEIDLDRLAGRVTLSVLVQNTSRRDAEAVVRFAPSTGAREPQDAALGTIPSGGSRRASVTFTGIHPLDLIGGTSVWRATVARGATTDDEKEIRIAPVATDLSNPDLMDFMIALAAMPGVSDNDVRDSRALMMDRLRADWERACDASGNPYKRDFDSEGTETVLGELVRITQRGRRSFVSPQVFDRLGHDIDALADDLPGAHPLLRKWMRKLAARVG